MRTLRLALNALAVAFALILALQWAIGVPLSDVYLSSARAMADAVEVGQEIVFSFETDDFVVFATDGRGDHPRIYAIKKKLGLWMIDFPSRRNIWGTSSIGQDLYIYFLNNSPHPELYLEAEDGSKIEPIQQAQITVSDNNHIYVFVIESYMDKLGNYRIVHKDDRGSILGGKAHELDFDEVHLSLLSHPDPSRVLTYSPDELRVLEDERANLLELFLDTIQSRTPIEPTSFEGSKLPLVQKDIYTTNTTLGSYIKIENADMVYRWDHTVNYHLILNGYYEKILMRHERNYFNRSISLHSQTQFYKVETIDKVVELFDLFFR